MSCVALWRFQLLQNFAERLHLIVAPAAEQAEMLRSASKQSIKLYPLVRVFCQELAGQIRDEFEQERCLICWAVVCLFVTRPWLSGGGHNAKLNDECFRAEQGRDWHVEARFCSNHPSGQIVIFRLNGIVSTGSPWQPLFLLCNASPRQKALPHRPDLMKLMAIIRNLLAWELEPMRWRRTASLWKLTHLWRMSRKSISFLSAKPYRWKPTPSPHTKLLLPHLWKHQSCISWTAADENTRNMSLPPNWIPLSRAEGNPVGEENSACMV